MNRFINVLPGHTLEVEDLGFDGKIDQVRRSVKQHIGKEFGLVDLTSLGARNSDSDGDLLFDQIRQIVVGTVPGSRLDAEIAGFVCPGHAVVNEENVDLMFLGVCDLGELKTSRRRLIVVLAQNEKKICHGFLLSSDPNRTILLFTPPL
jgi:hypothetical protein